MRFLIAVFLFIIGLFISGCEIYTTPFDISGVVQIRSPEIVSYYAPDYYRVYDHGYMIRNHPLYFRHPGNIWHLPPPHQYRPYRGGGRNHH